MEHFSKQVIDSRQVFIGFPQGKPNMFSLVSVGFEKCLPEFLVERVSYPETGRSNSEIEFTTIEFIISGNGELCLGGSNFNLEPGSLFSYKTSGGSVVSEGMRLRFAKSALSLHGLARCRRCLTAAAAASTKMPEPKQCPETMCTNQSH